MKRLTLLAVMLTALLAAGAATAVATAHTSSGTVAAAGQPAGTVQVRLDVQKFVRTGRRLVARGTAIATYTSQSAGRTVVRRPFTARVSVAPQKAGTGATTCPVLTLQIDQVSLDLLGLHVDLSKLVLTVTANRDGGALGKLFCSLSEAQLTTAPTATASKLTSVARHGGLATKGVGFGVPTRQIQAIGPGPCSIVDLLLGPLHLDLLGLVVDLNQVHLQITAAPDGGILGSLLCSLTNPTTTTTTTTAAPAP